MSERNYPPTKTPYTKYSPEGENLETHIIALPSALAESAFGYQELIVNILDVEKACQRDTSKNTSPTSSSSSLLEKKRRFLGAVQDCGLSVLSIDRDT